MPPPSLAMLLLKVLLINNYRSRVEDTATESRCVAAERAVNDRQCRDARVQDATAEAALTVPDRQAGNRDRFCTCNSLEDATRGIAAKSQDVGAGAVDCHAFVHEQLAAGERDGARHARCVNVSPSFASTSA